MEQALTQLEFKILFEDFNYYANISNALTWLKTFCKAHRENVNVNDTSHTCKF